MLVDPAFANCVIERSAYADLQGAATIRFMPSANAMVVSNTFQMTLDNKTILEGIVMWSDQVPRPNGMLMYKCPEGDVTGDELAACTVWQGVIYTTDKNGNIELLPGEGAAPPEKLIFPDLGHALRMSAAYGETGFAKTPWDVFAMSGCQDTQ